MARHRADVNLAVADGITPLHAAVNLDETWQVGEWVRLTKVYEGGVVQ